MAGGLWAKDSVLQCGEIVRELPVLPQEISFGSLNIVFNDADLEFSKLRDTTPWMNRPVAVNYGDFYSGASAMGRIYTGKVSDWTIGNRECSIQTRDTSAEALTKELSAKLEKSIYPYLPEGAEAVLEPIIYGEVVSEATNPNDKHGALPAYLCNDQADRGLDTHFWYLVARHPVTKVVDVYLDGQRMLPAEYEAVEAVVHGETKTYLKIPKDLILYLSYQGEMVRPTDRTVTVDVKGVKDAGGNLITNPVDQLKHYLKTFVGVADASIDSDCFAAASAQFTYDSAFAVTGNKVTHLDVVNGFAKSFNLMTYTSRYGKFMCLYATLGFEGITQELPHLTDENDIIAGSFKVYNVKDVASAIKYSYQFDYGQGKYLQTKTETDSVEAENLTGEGGPGIEIPVDYPYVRDDLTALNVTMERMSLMRESTFVAEFELPIKYASANKLELGDFVRVTHWEGPNASGEGFKEVVHRIIGLRTNIEPRDMGVKVRALCLGGYLQFGMILGDENEIAAMWDDASEYDKTFAYMGDEDNPDVEPVKMML